MGGVLLERDWELGELEAAVGEAAAGAGRLVVIEAPAGLGKTRLLQAVREAAEPAGLNTLAARATELERDFPFGLVRQLFEPVLTALPAPERDDLIGAARGALGMTGDGVPAGLGDRFTVLHGLYRLTASLAERQPLLLTIDDLHWADAASLDYVRFLLPRLDELGVLVAIASRSGEPDTPPDVARIATDPLARRLRPHALSRDATALLLSAKLGDEPADAFAATCHEVSGGNPFLLDELARTLALRGVRPAAEHAALVRELTPAGVADSIALRLRRLSPSAHALAHALVILGDDSDPRLVAALAGRSHDAAQQAADELRSAAILDPEAALRFAHPLVRTAIRSELGAGRRAAEHARAAALLREQGADAEQIATHLLARDPSGDAETVETLVAASMQAFVSGAPHSAIAYLTRALAEPPAPDQRALVLGPLVLAGVATGDQSVFDAIEADVLDELERTPQLRGLWTPLVAAWMVSHRRIDQALALLEDGIAEATRRGDLESALRLDAMLNAFAEPPLAVTRARLEPYFDGIATDSLGGRLVAALQAEWSMSDGSASEAVEAARRALAGDRFFVEQPERSFPAWPLWALIAADELAEARRIAERFVGIAQELGATLLLASAFTLRGRMAAAAGELVAATADHSRAVEIAELGGLTLAVPLLRVLLVEVLIDRDELQAAAAELDAADVVDDFTGYSAWFNLPLLQRGRLLMMRGRPGEAAALFMNFHVRLQQQGISGNPLVPAAGWAARAFAALGEHDRARELAEEQLAHATRWGAPSALSDALRAKAAAVGGDEGIELLRQAVAVMRESPARLERAHALAELGAALRRAKRRVEAREPLREALDLARRCGATGLAKHADDELQACGERRRRHTPIGTDSLTPSERRVAELAASGMTNRQIAQTLFLTTKTIETHLSAAYDKLGIRSRHQLADTLAVSAEA